MRRLRERQLTVEWGKTSGGGAGWASGWSAPASGSNDFVVGVPWAMTARSVHDQGG
jgi:hypothetical protein